MTGADSAVGVEQKPRARYTRVQRKRLIKRIKEILKGGGITSAQEVADKLNEMGLKNPAGEQFDGIHVRGVINRAGISMRKVAAKSRRRAEEPAPLSPIMTAEIRAVPIRRAYRLPDTAVGILTDATLSDAQKVRMLITYAELESA